MKLIQSFVLLFTIQSAAFSQKVNYSLPNSHHYYIEKEEYKRLVDFTFQQLEDFDILALEGGEISIQMNGYPYQLSLLPFLQKHTKNTQELQNAIKDHISSLVDAYHDQQMLAGADFSTAKKYLRLRLYPQEAVDTHEDAVWLSRSDLEGIATCVIIELPSAVATVANQQLERWGVSKEEIFRVAAENSRKQDYETHYQWLGEDSTELIAVASRQDASSAVLTIHEVIPNSMGEYGAIVSVPHRDMVLVHNLHQESAKNLQKFIEQLHSFVLEQYQQHPQPVSPFFYWYQGGKYVRIRLGKDPNGNLHVFPPRSLSSL